MSAQDYRIDPLRLGARSTGIKVRARWVETKKVGTCDIAELDRESLLTWLRSRGGSNEWAENTVLILLGHE